MTQTEWWQTGIVYQIYPRSFQDTNSDGVGDLKGITARLDYLEWLGVDAVWISPIYPSPMADFGYDVADYCGIDPVFGTMEDFEQLLAEVHRRGLKLILDFVPNHSSVEHDWFRESRASRDNPRRDWYIWRDPAPDGGPPNNWLANFGGPGWTFDEATGQYYYHAFLPEQPDLNWRNPDVMAAMLDTLRFWLAKGVDGFRVDVIWHLMKDPEFRDNPANPSWDEHQASINRLLQIHSCDHPDIHKVVAAMRAVIDECPGRVLIGEIYLPLERLVAFYGGRELEGAHLPFNFQLIFTAWHAAAIAQTIRDYEAKLPAGGWPNWVLSNHDQPRIASRVGAAGARIAAMLLLTLRGTPTLYYGDELGLEAVPIPPERVQDPWEKNEPGLGFGRDPSRTPMPWAREEYGGFSEARPWLPLNPDCHSRNVDALAGDGASILSLYRKLIALRRAEPALNSGSWAPFAVAGDVLAYERRHGDRRLVVALNFATEPADVELPNGGASILLSTGRDRAGERIEHVLSLGGCEGVIAAL